MIDFNSLPIRKEKNEQWFYASSDWAVANGTVQVWNKPPGITMVYMFLIAGGGGGGSGRSGITVNSGGGGGGATSGAIGLLVPAAFIPNQLKIQVGLGGSGAAPNAPVNNGNQGLTGGNSCIYIGDSYSLQNAFIATNGGGGPGGGGTNAAGGAGGTVGSNTFGAFSYLGVLIGGYAGTGGSPSNGSLTTPSDLTVTRLLNGAGSGGGGVSLTTSYNGGGHSGLVTYGGTGLGAGIAPGGHGSLLNSSQRNPILSYGGGGGAGNHLGVGGNGADGSGFGAGGGGGGAGLTSGGRGGNGSPGVVVITCW